MVDTRWSETIAVGSLAFIGDQQRTDGRGDLAKPFTMTADIAFKSKIENPKLIE
jgi:hypothetical protein